MSFSVRLPLCVAATMAVFWFAPMSAAPIPINGAAANVNGVPITQQDINGQLASRRDELLRKHIGSDLERAVQQARVDSLRQLIDNQLILQEFAKRGGTIPQREIDREIERIAREHFNGDKQRLASELARSGQTMARFSVNLRDQLIVREMRRAVLGLPDPPSPQAVERAYREHADEFRGESFIRYRQIKVPAISFEPGATAQGQRALANEIHGRVEAGADFAELAKQYSSLPNAADGGLAPVRSRSELVEWIREPLFSTDVGQVTDVIEQPDGYYLFLVENIELGELTPLDKVRPQLEEIVREESQKDEYEAWMRRLRSEAVIQVTDGELAAAGEAPSSIRQARPRETFQPVAGNAPAPVNAIEAEVVRP